MADSEISIRGVGKVNGTGSGIGVTALDQNDLDIDDQEFARSFR